MFSERRKESLQTCMLILHILPVLDQGLVRLGAQKSFHRKFIYLLFLGKGNRKPYFHSFPPLIRRRRKNLEDSFYHVISSTGKFMTISNKTLFRFFFLCCSSDCALFAFDSLYKGVDHFSGSCWAFFSKLLKISNLHKGSTSCSHWQLKLAS